MLISIVIPLYNKEDYILRAIKSVLNQTHQKIELIVVDDGSTDNSLAKLASISDQRLKIIKQKNAGVSSARNTGVKASSANWVSFLDADDEYKPTFLEEIINFINTYKDQNISFVGTNYYFEKNPEITINNDLSKGIYDYLKLFKNQKSPNSSSTTCVNKNKFLQIGGFPEGIKQFEDWITWCKLALVGNFGYINKQLGIYHYVKDSVAQSSREPQAFYNDAILLPITISNLSHKYILDKKRKKVICMCISEFALNISNQLIRNGNKKLGLKMLRYICNYKVFITMKKRTFKIIIHLITPLFFKRIIN